MQTWSVEGTLLPEGGPVAWWVAHGVLRDEPVPDAEPLPGRFVLPGLVDAHCHLSVAVGPDGPVALDARQAAGNLTALAASGVLGVRDTGGPRGVVLSLQPAARDPLLLACGRFLSTPGQYYPAVFEPVVPEQLLEAAEDELRQGARWLKVVADFPADQTPPAVPTYDLDVLRQLVDLAHLRGARIAAHTTTGYASDLVAVGIDSIEHGPALTDDDVARLGSRGGAWTPTLGAVLAVDDRSTPEQRARVAERREQLRETLPRAVAAGVRVLTGSDVVGDVPGEVALLVEHGLAPAAALAAASSAAREYLHLPGLRPGDSADLVSYEQDPRDDPEVLRRPAAVLRAGIRVA